MSTVTKSPYHIVDRNSYLRGYLPPRLERLRRAARFDPSFAREVRAIEDKLVPQRVNITEVSLRIGTPWIPSRFYEEFCQETFNVAARFFYNADTSTWDVRVADSKAESDGLAVWAAGFTLPQAREAVAKASESEQEAFAALGSWKCSTYSAVDERSSRGLINQILALKFPTVRVWRAGEKPTTGVDSELLTDVLRAKIDDLHRSFASFIQNHDDVEELEDIYNARFSGWVIPNWDGCARFGGSYDIARNVLKHLGMDADWADKLYEFQLDAIWRFAREPGMLAFEVGLGKTLTSVTIAMLRKHWGVCNRAMFVVQKSTLARFAAEYSSLFPHARVLVASPGQTSEKIRQSFLASVCYGHWDAIILTHDSFEAIPISRNTEMQFAREAVESYSAALAKLEEVGESAKSEKGNRRSNAVAKTLERQRSKALARVAMLTETSDTGLTWDMLGVDYLVVDEVQRYKNNLGDTTLGNLPGVSATQSSRAVNFEVKLLELRRRAGANSFLLMTGTPEPTNSIVGIYCFMRYLLLDEAKQIGCTHFDAWVAMFSEVSYDREPKMNGNFELVPRLRRFINTTELSTLYRSRVHRKTVKDVADQVKVPKPIYHHVSCPLSPSQQQIIADLEARYVALREYTSWVSSNKSGSLPPLPRLWVWQDDDGYAAQWVDRGNAKLKRDRILHPLTDEPVRADRIGLNAKITNGGIHIETFILDDEGFVDADASKRINEQDVQLCLVRDNFLSIYGELRKVSVAPQLVDPLLDITPTEKLVMAADNISRIYHETRDTKATQLVFCDMGTPGGSAKFPFYHKLRELCANRGVPREQFAFVHEHSRNDDVREALFESVRSGEVAILMGSTEPMGVGVNVQDRVVAMHKIDVPLRPDQDEQREGRAIRQGNMHDEVQVYQYLSEGMRGTFGADTMQFNLLAVKAQLRNAFWSGDRLTRTIEEEDSSADLYLLMMAEASGDRSFLERIKLEDEIKKTRTRKSVLESSINRFNRVPKPNRQPSKGSIAWFAKQADDIKLDYAAACRDADVVADYLDGSNRLQIELFECQPDLFQEGCAVCFDLVPGRQGVTDGRKALLRALQFRRNAIERERSESRQLVVTRRLGTYCGLSLMVNCVQSLHGISSFELYLEGADAYALPWYSDPKNLCNAFLNAVNRIAELPEQRANNIEQAGSAVTKAVQQRDRMVQQLAEESAALDDLTERMRFMISDLSS